MTRAIREEFNQFFQGLDPKYYTYSKSHYARLVGLKSSAVQDLIDKRELNFFVFAGVEIIIAPTSLLFAHEGKPLVQDFADHFEAILRSQASESNTLASGPTEAINHEFES